MAAQPLTAVEQEMGKGLTVPEGMKLLGWTIYVL